MKAVVVAHGDIHPADRAVIEDGVFVVAADGGALALERWERLPDLVVGDMDSLGEDAIRRLAKRGVQVATFPAAKDETDVELAVARAIEAGAREVVLLGALGGPRLDHEAANLLLLTYGGYDGVSLEARRGPMRVRGLRAGGSHELAGPVGALVTLLPVGGDAEGIQTEGLRYALRGETLRFGRARGVSNVVVSLPARVSLARGALLVFEVPEGGD